MLEASPRPFRLGGPDSPNGIKHKLFGVGQTITAPDGREGRFLVRGTWNTEIVERLTPDDGDIVMSKQRYSSVCGTERDTILKTLGMTPLFFIECTTSVCVESTLQDASFRD